MSLTTKQTPRGQVVVGDLPADFLMVQQSVQVHPQQQYNDEMTARMLQAQQGGYAGGMQLPTNVKGRLSVSLSQAKLAKNYSITKMDPYCRIRIGHAVFETATAASGGKTPRWNKTVQCFLPNGVTNAYIEIFDEKTFQGDDRIAWAYIDIPDKAVNGGEVVDDWYKLSGKQGDEMEGMINLVFSFTPSDPVQMAPQPSVMPQVVMMPGAPGMYPAYRPAFQPAFQPGFQPTYPAMMQPMPIGMQPQGMQPQGMQPQGMQPQGMQPGQPVQMPPREPPKMSEDDLNQCKDMFPNIDMEVIKSVAESQRGNKDSTINALLTIND